MTACGFDRLSCEAVVVQDLLAFVADEHPQWPAFVLELTEIGDAELGLDGDNQVIRRLDRRKQPQVPSGTLGRVGALARVSSLQVLDAGGAEIDRSAGQRI